MGAENGDIDAQRLSLRVRQTGSAPSEEFFALVRELSDKQKQRIRDKARWEGVSWLGVLADWPDLFEPEHDHVR